MKGILCGLRDKINMNIFTLARNIDNKKLKVIYTFHLIMILHSRLQLTEKNINFNSSSDRTVIRSLSSSSSNLKQQTSSHAASNLINSWQTYGPTELTLYRAKAVILLHRICYIESSWYTACWWVGCYVWYTEGEWVGPQATQAPPHCTKCNSPPIKGQCTNHHIAV